MDFNQKVKEYLAIEAPSISFPIDYDRKKRMVSLALRYGEAFENYNLSRQAMEGLSKSLEDLNKMISDLQESFKIVPKLIEEYSEMAEEISHWVSKIRILSQLVCLREPDFAKKYSSHLETLYVYNPEKLNIKQILNEANNAKNLIDHNPELFKDSGFSPKEQGDINETLKKLSLIESELQHHNKNSPETANEIRNLYLGVKERCRELSLVGQLVFFDQPELLGDFKS